jgi:hypothetical protein
MTDEHDTPTLDDVMETSEPTTPHRHDHAKTPKHVDEDELDRKTALEATEVGLDDGDVDNRS